MKLKSLFPLGGNLLAALFLSLEIAGVPARATVRLPELLGDHMVLQQNTNVAIWGFACAGETVTVESSWGGKASAVADSQGNWLARIKTPAAQPVSGGLHPENITLTSSQGNNLQIKDVLIGEVWLASGQSNMKMWLMPGYPRGYCAWYGEKFWSEKNGGECLKAERPGLRLFNVEQSPSTTPQSDCRSAMPDHMPQPMDAHGLLPEVLHGWQRCTRNSADRFSAVAYYFAAALQDRLDVPVGVVESAYGGTHIESWIGAEALRTLPEFSKFTGPAHNNPLNFSGSKSCLFNGMIAPLAKMSWSGVIWYQGESNRGNSAARYGALMKLLITDWRKQMGDETLPFYFVRIPPLPGPANVDGVRAGQASALALPNTGMAEIDDVADPNCIHPANKRDVGRRLALQALTKTYGKTAEAAAPAK